MTGLEALLQIFELEPIEEDIFRAVSYDLGFPNLFGGQVVGQALLAAARTVAPEREAHSLHAYFMRAGDAKAPVVYQVARPRDGRSFTTRHVTAVQHGRPIFEMSASFQIREQGYEHQIPMPEDVPPPEELKSHRELYEAKADRLPDRLRETLLCERPVEIRPARPIPEIKNEPREPIKQLWFRAAGPVPDDPQLHQAVLAYASDFELLGTSMLPHGVTFFEGKVQAASLDHALWIHRPFRVDDWLLYDTDSPNASNARGLNFGRIFSRDGTLVASVAQEGLVRPIPAKPR